MGIGEITRLKLKKTYNSPELLKPNYHSELEF